MHFKKAHGTGLLSPIKLPRKALFRNAHKGYQSTLRGVNEFAVEIPFDGGILSC
jgi:hypothetical protein